LVSLGGKQDGNRIIVWNMEEGRSEAVSPASMKPDETCQGVSFLNRNPHKFVSVHNIAIKVWTFDPNTKKLACVDC